MLKLYSAEEGEISLVAQRVKNAYQRGDAGDTGLIPGSGRSHGGGNGNPLQYSCLESPTDRGAWWATVRGVANSLDTTKRLTLSVSLRALTRTG